MFGTSKRSVPRIDVICDKCKKEFTEKYRIFEKRVEYSGFEYCGKCARPIASSISGKKGTYDSNGNLKENSGRFSTNKWNSMSQDELNGKIEHLKNISISHHAYLSENPDKKEEHYKKVYQHSSIGYISKGQSEIFDLLKHDGYVLDGFICGMKVDIINFDKKIAIEYNGDMWHCNPRTWKPDDYNSAIKMNAVDKWKLDRARRFKLRNMGFEVHVIWESTWLNDKNKIYELINKILDCDFEFHKWIPKDKINKRNKKTKKYNKRINSEPRYRDYVWRVDTPYNGIIYINSRTDLYQKIKKAQSQQIKYTKVPYTKDIILWNGEMIELKLDTTFKCPTCGFIGKVMQHMKRYHYDNCKYKK